jgi:hypothetical protein
MADVSDAELERADALGKAMLDREPRASSARYDTETGRVIVDLVNGCSYAFPAKLVQDLQGAGDDDLALIEVDGVGFNLRFPALDVDLFVPALVSGVFGNRDWMTRALARIAGQKKSAAKAAAARANGAKGGRPPKAARG